MEGKYTNENIKQAFSAVAKGHIDIYNPNGNPLENADHKRKKFGANLPSTAEHRGTELPLDEMPPRPSRNLLNRMAPWPPSSDLAKC